MAQTLHAVAASTNEQVDDWRSNLEVAVGSYCGLLGGREIMMNFR
jgi:hypothetical protein